ncbi:hypothetical protein FRB96_009544 [Tulasnella sp. 330]|nr:hypothetical protein FRB96_009544 [Tulasnella sp. 330]KAG8880133.1 hypothetical protein FRB97_001064 [Tulasnella sp. 331]KAG8886739.1 hypothetical protein FRB98_001040 [Tulasnella sp. 332]
MASHFKYPPSSKPDPILLTLFANRFMSVAEAMGSSLQKTAISTNIKERLDFSCAVFAPDGDLVANAPFIPIHLGSMSFAVKYQMRLLGDDLKEGDVLMTNSPRAGGSHLPDITLITPVFSKPTKDKPKPEIIFFTASRGHHADIGGILPGSMPPTSVTIFEEGAEIVSFKIVSNGIFDRDGMLEYLVERPAKYEGCSGCRNIRDVESDLKAQIAANHKGIGLLHTLISEYSLETVQQYMLHIRYNAEQSVRTLLRDVAKRRGSNVLSARDYLDDGSPIQISVVIDEEKGSAVIDFAGTGPELRGNLNAPISVVHSAVIYCMRSMLDVDIPLNAGCLVPIEIKIPDESLLHPSDTAAVCAGNVLTSQRIVDVVLKAFHACAASQGCCNNLTFGQGGKDRDGSTIAGGSGAGPNFHGVSGVHTHITNTRIGDVEILERRYPVLIHSFGIREDDDAKESGNGKWKGGKGVVRDIEFLEDIRVSILSERRAHAPYGLEGGGSGARGVNIWVKQPRPSDLVPPSAPVSSKSPDSGEGEVKQQPQPRIVNIGGKATVLMGKGDRLIVHTPGGGGWGAPEEGKGDQAHHGHGAEIGWATRGSWAERISAQASF